jgi:hypothetical protein
MFTSTNPTDTPEGREVITRAEAWRGSLSASDQLDLTALPELLDAFEEYQVFGDMFCSGASEVTPGPFDLSAEDRVVLDGLRRAHPSETDQIWADMFAS